jgi:hypothetical protein
MNQEYYPVFTVHECEFATQGLDVTRIVTFLVCM